jgi:acetolactate synthase regulatory subunit
MFRFTISAEVADDTLLRMLNYFAQRGLRPSRVHAEQFGDTMTMDIDQVGIGEHTASIIQEKMRACIGVTAVDVVPFPAHLVVAKIVI